jgi:hypothetical protein
LTIPTIARVRGLPMKTTAVAGCFAIAVAVWFAAPAVPAVVRQGSISALPVDYSLGPDSQPQPGVPTGALSRHVLAPGKFFPGTPRSMP